ncbi:uncharacterized protein LY89DRAFT_663718 [Mollisia scopiformis]|uniref:N-acetyltransferase domain-containing protein n=1 Tax=Mollisia scopiformis TaxID=149040 RepID=A0A194XSI6_MOLSC|nr:uncharacterized protein LY89DRAFT_663718 [Mollisia scopiformis]KUJ23265.1 hypothetical protein LY89DRAFT_663718 [Mollisia scopiformis]
MDYEAETLHLYLGRLTERYLLDFHALWSSEENLKWSVRPPMKTLEQSSDWMKQAFSVENPNLDKFAIIIKPQFDAFHTEERGTQPRMIGICGTLGEGAEIMYMLDHHYWRKGYATEALNSLVGPEGTFWKFPNRKHIKTLTAHIDADNLASIKTIAKVGGREGERQVKCYSLARDRSEDGMVPKEKLRDMSIGTASPVPQLILLATVNLTLPRTEIIKHSGPSHSMAHLTPNNLESATSITSLVIVSQDPEALQHQQDNEASVLYILIHFTTCPNCRAPCQRAGGTNQMKCICNHQFDYSCGHSLDPTREASCRKCRQYETFIQFADIFTEAMTPPGPESQARKHLIRGLKDSD